jgi:hypothetical protein
MFLLDKRFRSFLKYALLPLAFWRGDAALSEYIITEVWIWVLAQLAAGLTYYVVFWILLYMIMEFANNVIEIVAGEPVKENRKKISR